MISPREARSIIRKAKRRVPHGEDVSHLNITAMMDMMTIIVVFLIKSVAVGHPPPTDLQLPRSTTVQKPQKESTVLTITKTSILVDGEAIVAVNNGSVDAAAKTGGADGIEIGELRLQLERLGKRTRTIDQLQGISRGDEGLELTLIADRGTPFRLLHEVMYTAGNAKYGKFRLVVLRPEGSD